MTEDTILREKREQLKCKIDAGNYKTLGKLLVDIVEIRLHHFTQSYKPIPFWFSLLIITLSIMVLGLLISIFLEEVPANSEALLIGISGLCLIYVMLFTLELYMRVCFSFARNYLLNTIESVTDLIDFQHWLNTTFSIKKQFFFGIVFTVLGLFYLVSRTPKIFFESIFFGFGPLISGISLSVIVGSYYYFFFQGLPLAIRFSSRYQFKLYTADPSSSEFIGRLSDTLSYGVYISAGFVALFTLHSSLYDSLTQTNVYLLILIGWIPVTGFFAANQYVLSKIITRSKWKALSDIQEKIEKLQGKEDIPTQDTIAHIRTLIEYHDYIKSTRNSVLSLRATLNFMNSLLLPLLALIIGNLDKLLELFG